MFYTNIRSPVNPISLRMPYAVARGHACHATMSVRLGLDAGRHRPRPHPCRARRDGERRVLQGCPRAARHSCRSGRRERGAQFANLVVTDDEPRTSGPVHIAFVAESREQVDAFHRAGIEAGGRDNGAPGVREQYSSDEGGRYYAAFVLGPRRQQRRGRSSRVRLSQGATTRAACACP